MTGTFPTEPHLFDCLLVLSGASGQLFRSLRTLCPECPDSLGLSRKKVGIMHIGF